MISLVNLSKLACLKTLEITLVEENAECNFNEEQLFVQIARNTKLEEFVKKQQLRVDENGHFWHAVQLKNNVIIAGNKNLGLEVLKDSRYSLYCYVYLMGVPGSKELYSYQPFTYETLMRNIVYELLYLHRQRAHSQQYIGAITSDFQFTYFGLQDFFMIYGKEINDILQFYARYTNNVLLHSLITQSCEKHECNYSICK